MVWVPALPPIEATIGMRMASATICSIVASNSEITQEASTAVSRLMKSQAKRERVVSSTVSLIVSSAPTPPRCSTCSSASSWITSTMSSAISVPMRRPLSSVTAAETRLYLSKRQATSACSSVARNTVCSSSMMASIFFSGGWRSRRDTGTVPTR